MAFVDSLAFVEATLLLAAVLIGYAGITAAWALRHNDAAGLKNALRSSAAPIGFVGGVSAVVGAWGEMAWPLPGSYNILFFDVYLLFALTLLVLAVSLATSAKLQFAGLFAFVAGAVTIGYGWSGYQLGMTKDPLETFLMYGAFGLTGILAFPATVVVDHYLAHPESRVYAAKAPTAARRPSLMGASRAVQPVVPGTSAASPSTEAAPRLFRVPLYINATLIVFLVMVALAAISALFYLDSTVPAHLLKAP